MNGKKKLNLLPPEIKNKDVNKSFLCAAAAVGGIFLIALAVQYIHIGMLSMQINNTIKNNELYNSEQQTLEKLKSNIKKYESFIFDYESGCFPLSEFMDDLESIRPPDVFIISVDSSERLINEGINDNPETVKKKADTSEDDEAEIDEEESAKPKIEYETDISDREIVVRGYGDNQASISQFIYDLSLLPYINKIKITAIEEHKIENGIYNIFEIIITGGVYS